MNSGMTCSVCGLIGYDRKKGCPNESRHDRLIETKRKLRTSMKPIGENYFDPLNRAITRAHERVLERMGKDADEGVLGASLADFSMRGSE